MSGVLVYLVAGWLLLAGLLGVVKSRHLVHQVLCLNVIQASTYLLLIGVGYREGGAAPILTGIPPNTPVVDPVVQALVLTDVVVGVSVAALLLALCLQAFKRFGTFDPEKIRQLRG
jgi:multicomponent Na+:H+ antiporter subunit C